MSVTIEGVPESVPFQKVNELVRAFGFETRGLVSLHIGIKTVTAEVLAVGPDGLFGGLDGAAKHTVVIPIDRKPAASTLQHKDHVHVAV